MSSDLKLLYLLFLCATGALCSLEDYNRKRSDLIAEEMRMSIGGKLELSDVEQVANDHVMRLKYRDLDEAFDNPQYFNYSKHYFTYKKEFDKSPLYKLIKRMPKGALLHAHDTALLGADYLVNVTYRDDLYVCFLEDTLKLIFASELPEPRTCQTKWQLMRDARFSSGNVEKFDADLRKYFTLVVDDPEVTYTDINVVWTRFQNIFSVITPMLCYRPVWKQYFYDALKAFRDDSIMYAEIRSTLPALYELNGTVHDSVSTAYDYADALAHFKEDFPDFYGAKLIYAPLRMVEPSVVSEYLEVAKILQKELPEFYAGFDLVGQEDLGKALYVFLPELLKFQDHMNFFFHAGETNWYGTTSDFNIIDAILLGTQRIGHGYAILKHPKLMEIVQERGIALEVNIISNQVLKLVDDVRNHPASHFFSRDIPMVLSSDDPGLWEAEPLSHDFYVAFVGTASRYADLRLLKKLAMNSLAYSSLSKSEKLDALFRFEESWMKFIGKLVNSPGIDLV